MKLLHPIKHGWKIFRVWGDDPRTLVHGVRGSTRLPSDVWVQKAYGTPGFNFFETMLDASNYKQRFRVRAPTLIICRTSVEGVTIKLSYPGILLAERILIDATYWRDAVARHSIGTPLPVFAEPDLCQTKARTCPKSPTTSAVS